MTFSAPPPIHEKAIIPQPLWALGRDLVLTVLMWVFFLYLLRDAYIDAVILWQLIFFGQDSPEIPHIMSVLKEIGVYALALIPISAVLISWGKYNQIRFGRQDRQRRRAASPPVEAASLAQTFQLDKTHVEAIQNAQHILLDHDANGTLIGIVCDEHLLLSSKDR